MNIGMNGVLVLLHSFSFCLYLSFFSLYSFTLFTFSPLPKAEDTPIPSEFQHFYFLIPNTSRR